MNKIAAYVEQKARKAIFDMAKDLPSKFKNLAGHEETKAFHRNALNKGNPSGGPSRKESLDALTLTRGTEKK